VTLAVVLAEVALALHVCGGRWQARTADLLLVRTIGQDRDVRPPSAANKKPRSPTLHTRQRTNANVNGDGIDVAWIEFASAQPPPSGYEPEKPAP
jgi:hypothetical protein